jgi:hypothetical protein
LTNDMIRLVPGFSSFYTQGQWKRIYSVETKKILVFKVFSRSTTLFCYHKKPFWSTPSEETVVYFGS